MANEKSILDLAKQGNPKAIQVLMNRSLQSKGITVKTAFKNDCLQILLESAQVPDQQELVQYLRRGITNLGTQSIKRVKIYGKKAGHSYPDWNQEFTFAVPSNNPLVNQIQPLKENRELNQNNINEQATESKDSFKISPSTSKNNPDLTLRKFNFKPALFTLAAIVGLFLLIEYGIVALVLASIISLIPAKIASSKGKSIIRWWCYGFILFIAALPAAILINKNNSFTQSIPIQSLSRIIDNNKYLKKFAFSPVLQVALVSFIGIIFMIGGDFMKSKQQAKHFNCLSEIPSSYPAYLKEFMLEKCLNK